MLVVVTSSGILKRVVHHKFVLRDEAELFIGALIDPFNTSSLQSNSGVDPGIVKRGAGLELD